ncbi:MAG: class II aldolase/adducin family protein, partial [Betaproteobacteria bacterium]
MPPAADPGLVDKLVVANRILYRQGVVDGFGHVSVRHDASPGHFLLARNMAPGLVRAGDIVTFDLDGAALDAAGRRVYLERFIHSEIYRARPDVQAVVHSHSPNVIPFGVTGQALRPVFHMSGFLGEGTALFEIR